MEGKTKLLKAFFALPVIAEKSSESHIKGNPNIERKES
jgi:hypothetical protein